MENGREEQDILQIWQTCVEMTNSVTQRRETMNSLFVTINLAVIAAVSWMWDIRTACLCAAGLVLRVVWLLYIQLFQAPEPGEVQGDLRTRAEDGHISVQR